MKIWTISDLHTESGFWVPREIPDADVCILAGDIGRGAEETIRWAAQQIRPHMPVIAVLGNHEFYRGDLETERRTAQAQGWRQDIAVLDDMAWTVGDVRFVGATLWSDYELYGAPETAMKAARLGMNDHRLIRIGGRQFMPADALRMHKQSVAYLEAVLQLVTEPKF